jgi:hypothetical protein
MNAAGDTGVHGVLVRDEASPPVPVADQRLSEAISRRMVAEGEALSLRDVLADLVRSLGCDECHGPHQPGSAAIFHCHCRCHERFASACAEARQLLAAGRLR